MPGIGGLARDGVRRDQLEQESELSPSKKRNSCRVKGVSPAMVCRGHREDSDEIEWMWWRFWGTRGHGEVKRTFNPCGRTVGMETREPLKPDGVEEDAGAKQRTTAASAPVGWSEEERGHVVAFFTLLDQWDRQFREKKGAA